MQVLSSRNLQSELSGRSRSSNKITSSFLRHPCDSGGILNGKERNGMDGCTAQLLLPENVSGNDNVALGGYSPISVFRGKPVRGREDITFVVSLRLSGNLEHAKAIKRT